ncbi:MAG: hydrogen peroxide-dependent heme synthase [Bryobacteraceae bacterium]|nr:hydrogen peroxide-dependent heme synthase [Bryobacteraceae bacterium]
MSTDTVNAAAALPAVPLTVEGASLLHQMLRVRWSAWRALDPEQRATFVDEASRTLSEMERGESAGGQSAVYSMLGHKGDLMFVHFRRGFDGLKRAELSLTRLALWECLEPVTSYLSMVELGLYESSSKTYQTLIEQGLQPGTADWDEKVEEALDRHRKAMAPRLWPEIPGARYICFYPMDRRRGEEKNWYQVPMAERQRMMHEHGLVGRRYADRVKQVISGSIGFDDWEWGVDLFAHDPLVFKRLIYEMRFDEVSAVYALFGQFYIGVRVPASELGELFEGRLPDIA